MHTFYICLALLFSVGLFDCAQAQQVTGRVIDDNGTPVSHAAIALITFPDSTAVSETLTDSQGNFRFGTYSGQAYILMVSHLGYQPQRSQSFTLRPGEQLSLGDITLEVDITLLAAVSVTARRPTISRQVDRMTIDVEGSTLTVGNSVLELLERTPGITSDGEGNFSIQGRGGVQVMIDGKATYLSGNQLALLLRGMQAREVSKVELMSSPSARQNAEGSGGIINIVTKSNRLSGFGGDAFVHASHGRQAQYALGGALHLKQGGWALQVSGSHGQDKSRTSSFYERLFYDGGNHAAITRQWEDNRTDPGRNYGLRAGIDYAADTSQAFGLGFHWIKGRYQSYTDAMLHLLRAPQTLMQQNTTQNHFDEGYNNLTFSAHYIRRFAGKGHQLTINADYAPHGNDYDNGYHTVYHDGSGQRVGYPAARRNVQDLSNTTYVGSVDYTRPLTATSKVELGWRATYLYIDNFVRNDTLHNGQQWSYDNLTSNRFRYGQHVQAVYAIYGGHWGNLEFQAGIRGEYTGTEAEQVTLDSLTQQHYIDLFPNLFVGYPLGDNHRLQLAYSKRIRRPGDHDVNVFRVYTDPYNYFEGNPRLTPSKTHALELVHVARNKLFTTFSFNRGNDVIMFITGEGAQPGQTLSRPENVGSFTNYGISVMYNGAFADWWKASHYANVFHNRYEGAFRGAVLDNASTSWSANSRHTFHAHGFRAELIGYYHSAMASGAYHTAPRYGVDAGIDRPLFTEKANIKFSVTGLVRNSTPENTAVFGNLRMFGYERPDNRRFVLAFTYRFGG